MSPPFAYSYGAAGDFARHDKKPEARVVMKFGAWPKRSLSEPAAVAEYKKMSRLPAFSLPGDFVVYVPSRRE